MKLTPRFAALVVSAAVVCLVPLLVSCAPSTPATSASVVVPSDQDAKPAVTTNAKRLAEEKAALEIIKNASAYDDSMNARIITDPADRLDSARGSATTVVVRIDRDGRPVDLSYLRFKGGFTTIAFGAKSGVPPRGYDHRILTDGDAVLALVDKLMASPSQTR